MVSRCMLNPDFTNLNGELRNDFEFYIPQLVSFLLYGHFEHNQKLMKVILLVLHQLLLLSFGVV